MQPSPGTARCLLTLFASCDLTLNVGVLGVGDVTVHEVGGVDCTDIARKRRQVGVSRVVEHVVLGRDNREAREREVHL